MGSRPITFLCLWPATDHELYCRHVPINNKKLSYRRGTTRCVVSIEILPIATQQCRRVTTRMPASSWSQISISCMMLRCWRTRCVKLLSRPHADLLCLTRFILASRIGTGCLLLCRISGGLTTTQWSWPSWPRSPGQLTEVRTLW